MHICAQYLTTRFLNCPILFTCKSELSFSATATNFSLIRRNLSIMYSLPLHHVLLCNTGTRLTRFLSRAAFFSFFLRLLIVSWIELRVTSRSQFCFTISLTSRFNRWFLHATRGIPNRSATLRLTLQLSAV